MTKIFEYKKNREKCVLIKITILFYKMQFANLAYSKKVPPLEQFREVHVLDLLCTPITLLTFQI